jgi:hypothetical protein
LSIQTTFSSGGEAGNGEWKSASTALLRYQGEPALLLTLRRRLDFELERRLLARIVDDDCHSHRPPTADFDWVCIFGPYLFISQHA